MTDLEKIELAMFRELEHQKRQVTQDLSAINILEGLLKQIARINKDHGEAEFNRDLQRREWSLRAGQ